MYSTQYTFHGVCFIKSVSHDVFFYSFFPRCVCHSMFPWCVIVSMLGAPYLSCIKCNKYFMHGMRGTYFYLVNVFVACILDDMCYQDICFYRFL